MKHIGIAGVTAEGAFLCARTILRQVEVQFPSTSGPEITLHMHHSSAYLTALSRADWSMVSSLLVSSIEKLRSAGADLAIIPANAVHYAIEEVSRQASLPVLNLVEEVAKEAHRRGMDRVAILGARWTMRGGLYTEPLGRRGIAAIVPSVEEQEVIHTIITGELLSFVVTPESTTRLLAIVDRLKAEECQAMVLACTELPLSLTEESCGAPVIDTTRVLAEAAVRAAQVG